MNDTFKQINEQKTTFASQEYGRVGVFRIKIRSFI